MCGSGKPEIDHEFLYLWKCMDELYRQVHRHLYDVVEALEILEIFVAAHALSEKKMKDITLFNQRCISHRIHLFSLHLHSNVRNKRKHVASWPNRFQIKLNFPKENPLASLRTTMDIPLK